ncbi:MarR family winged helix-turn-helix transcriptional regulator [Gloeobacter kilaueensis]|uniref:MarR family transcriptional regulator n=1 Tax=Gloeobacter kilaueensis (strain ATCC BAA-2537 / CCAP 1431/1 / ULC 316 / JS1) TaxID=1183438 RepID=U5QNS8_GLOK1|nr:MarR family transcriptional regulator [Gloeobacter kilaueensis]AGY60652.1 MarR family transcriptional regulator [Gloeobacter kilaueensis JS1]
MALAEHRQIPPQIVSDFERAQPQSLVMLIHLLRVGALLDKEVTDYVSRYGLTGPQVAVLRILQYFYDRGQDGLPLSEIGDCLSVTKANMTGLVDRLERDGLVIRDSDPLDRRIKRVRLTDKAHDLHNRMKPGFIQYLTDLMGVLEPAEKEQLLVSLGKLRRVLGDTGLGPCGPPTEPVNQ